MLQHVGLGGGLGVTVHLLVGRPGLGPPGMGPPGMAFRVSPRAVLGLWAPHPTPQVSDLGRRSDRS